MERSSLYHFITLKGKDHKETVGFLTFSGSTDGGTGSMMHLYKWTLSLVAYNGAGPCNKQSCTLRVWRVKRLQTLASEI